MSICKVCLHEIGDKDPCPKCHTAQGKKEVKEKKAKKDK